ncbi:predicted protein, partial [Nematostella vectensis]
MFFISVPSNPRKSHRRQRTFFSKEQTVILEGAFQYERFPGIQIREKLARELDIDESRIQVWFQNRRSRQNRQKRKTEHRSVPSRNHPSRVIRQRTFFSKEQTVILEGAFQYERFPGIQIREKLARELDIDESRIQVWFQNRRSR